MKIMNPFYYTYISEQVKNPQEFFQFFSPEVFREGTFKIGQPMNHFILGAQGFGKTMFLRFFHYKNQSYIFNNKLLFDFYKNTFGKKLPEKFAGIYYTVSLGPYTQFSGRGISSEDWSSLYGNYLNLVIFEEILRLLVYCTTNDGKDWAKAMGIYGAEDKIINAIGGIYGSGYFPKELFGDYKKYNKLSDFQRELIEKINTYHQIVSMQKIKQDDLPNYQIEPGRLPIDFIEALRDTKVLDKDIRLFILFDEYQELGMLTDNSLLPRIINTAIKITARTPNSLIEYKIGTRRYGIKELKIFGSETKIEREREYDIIDLENVFFERGGVKAYEKFIVDITKKRLKNYKYLQTKKFHEWFSHASQRKDISQLEDIFNRLKQEIEKKYTFDNIKKIYEDLFKNFPDNLFDQIVSIILLIKALRKNKIEEKEEIKKFIENNKTEKGWKKEAIDVYSFTVANIYNKRGKRYYGYETLVKISYPIALNYLRLCKKIFELGMGSFEDGKKHLTKEKQNIGVKIVTEDIFNEIGTEKSSSGSKVQQILYRLGVLFKEMHNLIPAWLITSFQIETTEYQKSSAKGLIDEAVDYSLLKKIDLKDQKNLRFIFNKILCPFFNLSVYPEDTYMSPL